MSDAKKASREQERLVPSGRRLRTWGSGYTWFVRVTKLILPVAALVIVGIVFARLSIDPQQQEITEMPKKDQTTAGNIELEGARYEGVDGQGRAYTLAAVSASRATDNPDTVLLDQPKADVTLATGSDNSSAKGQDDSLAKGQWLAVHAAKGAYETRTSKLDLTDGVTLFHDAGYEMKMDHLAIDITKQEASSDSAITLQGPGGKLSAAGVKVEKGGEMITFAGPAKILIFRTPQSKGAPG